ncbi:unnamed protein product [Gongylonema pulchrum]|uniref:PCI domain-containing protein n=1 Tax=Gongylonema pulchrum TaxID=637853 RepID=A0A183E8W9_9BILA|nr:unnamed protein product [Gongylonema pulchrum]
MADTKALPVFAFTDDRVQLQQLRGYMKEHGSSICEDGPADFNENLEELVRTVSILAKLENEKEVEMILNSISSLIVVLTPEAAYTIIRVFCDQLCAEFKGTGWNSNAASAVRTLSNLFFAFNKHARVQHMLYVALVTLCGRARIIGDLDTSNEKVNEYIRRWSLNRNEQRTLLRLIHWALINDGRADQAAKTMTALLGTYTDEDAASAVEDARECVRTAVVDPKSFSFDHLLRLSAVKLLQKSDPLMHEVIPLRNLSVEVDIPEGEELEEFIIDAIRMNAISGKINELKKELNVTSLQHRSFGRAQWELLQKRLGKINELKKELNVTSLQHRSFGRAQWELLQKRLVMLISSVRTSHRNIGSVFVNNQTT